MQIVLVTFMIHWSLLKKLSLILVILVGIHNSAQAGPVSSSLYIDVRDYGAKCDGTTDDSGAINNAINSSGAYGAVVKLPVGICAISVEIIVNKNGVTIEGAGHESTFIRPSSSINGIHIAGSASSGVFHNTIRKLSIQGGQSAIWIDKGANDTRIEDVTISNSTTGVAVIGDFHSGNANLTIHTVHINRVEVGSFGANGIYVREAGEIYLSSIRTTSNSTGAGIVFETGANAVYADRLNLLSSGYGLLIQNTITDLGLPSTTARPSQMFFTSVLGDTTQFAGIQINDGFQISLQKPWGSGSSGYGVFVAPAADEIELAEGFYINNVYHGLFIKGPRTTQVRVLGGKAISNGRTSAANPSYDGIAIDNLSQNVTVIGVSAYNSTAQGYGNTQRYGISIGSGSTNFIVSQNNARGNLVGGINNLGSAPYVFTGLNLP